MVPRRSSPARHLKARDLLSDARCEPARIKAGRWPSSRVARRLAPKNREGGTLARPLATSIAVEEQIAPA